MVLQELEAKIGNDCEKIQIDLSEQEYSETEIADVFRDAEQKLGQMILGENTSLDEVRSDLNLFSSIPDTGISIEWDSDRHQVIDSQGRIDRQQYKNEQAVIQEWIGGDTKMDHSCNSRSRRENYVKCR